MKSTTTNKPQGFTKEEQMAMRARAKELAAESRASKNRAAGEQDVMEAIAEMKEPDKSMAACIHELVTQAAPDLWPKTWYGMPAYATKDGKVVCFYQSGQKFGTRYATFGFQQEAHIDVGDMWPNAYSLTKMTPAVEAQIISLVKQAVS